MLRLNAPLWLHASRTSDLAGSRQGGIAVPRDERVHFDACALARIDDSAARGDLGLAFSRRLGEQFAAEGHLPIGFVEIVRTALEERGLRAPLRLIASTPRGDAEIIDGIGLTVENVDEIAIACGDADAARYLKDVALALARLVAGIDEAEFTVVEDAVRAKYHLGDTAAFPPDAARAAASLVAQFVEARTRESLSHDPAEQVALFVDAWLRNDSEYVFILEPLSANAREAIASLRADEVAAPAFEGASIPGPAGVQEPESTRPPSSAPPPPTPVEIPMEPRVVAPMPPKPRVRIRGTVFSRDPATGARGVVVCAREEGDPHSRIDGSRLARRAPDLLAALARRCAELEARARDVVAATFEAEGDELVSFATGSVDVSREARLAIGVALVHEGRASRSDAVARLRDLDLTRIRPCGVLHDGVLEPIALGTILSPGAVCGRVAFSGRQALAYRRCGFDVILMCDARNGDGPVLDLASAQGVVELLGDAATAIARASRRLGLPALGCAELRLDVDAGVAYGDATLLREGDSVTLDAHAGCLYAGALPIVERTPPAAKAELHAWRIAESTSLAPRS